MLILGRVVAIISKQLFMRNLQLDANAGRAILFTQCPRHCKSVSRPVAARYQPSLY
jgi:hypothetical protein